MKRLFFLFTLCFSLVACSMQAQAESDFLGIEQQTNYCTDEEGTIHQTQTEFPAMQKLQEALCQTEGHFSDDQAKGECIRYASVDGWGENPDGTSSDKAICPAYSRKGKKRSAIMHYPLE